jgi:hypothetical protein
MRRSAWAALAAVTGSLLSAGTAGAAAPPNDHYLASTRMALSDGSVARSFHDVADTAEATVQPDIFDPDSEGAKLGGGPAENTRCGQTDFGATVWYDFAPEVDGGAEVAASGYDTVVTVYEYDVKTARITRTVACENRPGAGEDLLLPSVKRGRHYTVQVGGAGATTGALDFTFSFFGDGDGDGVLDETPDKCPAIRGVSQDGGCPPELRSSPQVRYRDAPGGLRINEVTVSSLVAGSRVQARCRRCGRSQVRVARGRSVGFSRLAGQFVPNGAIIEILVTHASTKAGRYRYGAIGNYYRWTVSAGRIGKRVDRCLKPGKTTPSTRCT